MFILITSLKSLIRQPLIVSLLLINMIVMTLSLLTVLSVLNTEWKTYLRNRNTVIVTLQEYPPLKTLLDKLESWRDHPSGVSPSPLATAKLPLTYGTAQGVYSVSGFGKDNPALGLFSEFEPRPGEILLSYPLAAKLGDVRPDKLLGENIYINDSPFVVAGIVKDNSLDTAFISYESLAELANPLVTVVFAGTSSSDIVDTLMADLLPFHPTIRTEDDALILAQFERTLLRYTGIAALLALFSIISFLQLFQCKLRADTNRWNIFRLFGARRNDMLYAALIESLGITLTGFGSGFALFAILHKYVQIPYVALTFDTLVCIVAVVLLALLFVCLLAAMPFYIRRGGYERA
ncbi:ABC transporter permease [Paenibacillus sp. strain BS8-2]